MLQQPELEGLAHKKKRKKSASYSVPAHSNAVAHVMLDVQAAHLGHTFDYLIPEKYDDIARPGVLVRVRFGARRVNGIIWSRSDESHTTKDSLRFIDRVLSSGVLLSSSMRADILSIADAYGGTPANIIRLAVPQRIASVEEDAYFCNRSQKLRIKTLREKILPSLKFHEDSSSNLVEYNGSERVFRTSDERMIASYNNALSLKKALCHVNNPYSYISCDELNELRDFSNEVNNASQSSSFILDALPGSGRWAQDLAWIITTAIGSGRQVAVVLPTLREVNDVMRALMVCGIKPYKKLKNGEFSGDVVRLCAADTPADRYRSWIAISKGIVPCVLGTRAAMYAPVEGAALFVIVEDCAYQQADGMQPYAQARGVMRLRAKSHGGVFISMSFARSLVSQYEIDSEDYLRSSLKSNESNESNETNESNESNESDESNNSNNYQNSSLVSGKSEIITPFNSVRYEASAWVRWLNRETLEKIGDESAGLRVPDTAVRIIKDALSIGKPVLMSIPQDGVTQSVICTKCRHQARCRRCTGPIDFGIDGAHSRCAWCGNSLANWSCTYCSGKSLRAIRVGASGTIKQLSMLFPGVKLIVSSPHCLNGIVHWINEEAVIVVATPGAEPRVKRLNNNYSFENSRKDIDLEPDFKRAAGDDFVDSSDRDNSINGVSDVENIGENLQSNLQSNVSDVVYLNRSQKSDKNHNNISNISSIAYETFTGEYQVVALLDAWTSLYLTNLDGSYDVLESWMRASCACAAKSRGGCVMILGETHSAIAKSLESWDSSILASYELSERKRAALPPTVCAACVWGSRQAVMRALKNIGAIHNYCDEIESSKIKNNDNNADHYISSGFNKDIKNNDLPNIFVDNVAISPLLGIVPMHTPVSDHNLHFEELHDRVKAVVRVPLEFRGELVRRLRKELSEHSAFNYKGELRFSFDAKDLLAY